MTDEGRGRRDEGGVARSAVYEPVCGMNSPGLTSSNRLALLMHGSVTESYGKMGFGLMRYGVAPTVVVIDRTQAGNSLRALTGIACDAPIVASVAEALAYGPD